MESTAAVAAIRSRFDTEWAVSNSTVPVSWENEHSQYTTPPFVHVQIRFGASRIATLGGDSNNIYRQSGEVIIRIFETSAYGTDRVRDLADDAAGIFRGWRSSDLRFYTSAPTGAVEEDGNVAIVTVIASFFYDLTG
jgi:hypothetical protein